MNPSLAPGVSSETLRRKHPGLEHFESKSPRLKKSGE